MINLSGMQNGDNGRITWLMGASAALRDELGMQEDTRIHIVQHYENGDVIVHVNGKCVAMSHDIAFGVKVEPV